MRRDSVRGEEENQPVRRMTKASTTYILLEQLRQCSGGGEWGILVFKLCDRDAEQELHKLKASEKPGTVVPAAGARVYVCRGENNIGVVHLHLKVVNDLALEAKLHHRVASDLKDVGHLVSDAHLIECPNVVIVLLVEPLYFPGVILASHKSWDRAILPVVLKHG